MSKRTVEAHLAVNYQAQKLGRQESFSRTQTSVHERNADNRPNDVLHGNGWEQQWQWDINWTSRARLIVWL